MWYDVNNNVESCESFLVLMHGPLELKRGDGKSDRIRSTWERNVNCKLQIVHAR